MLYEALSAPQLFVGDPVCPSAPARPLVSADAAAVDVAVVVAAAKVAG